MSNMLLEMKEYIASGLRRKTLTTCSKWACQYRIMGNPFPGNWSFKNHPWIREPHDCKSEKIVAMKAAQMAFTEFGLNKTFFKIDIERVSCLYVLPNKQPDASDFSSARFDAALEFSPHLAKLFSDVKNVGHKRAGTVNLYIRGSRSRSGLKSIPAGFIVFDEFDEMAQENIPLAMERMSGQLKKELLEISTPTVNGFGIDKEFQESTQEHFNFHCPACNKIIELHFPESLVVTGDSLKDEKLALSYLKCLSCNAKLEHKKKYEYLNSGVWVPSNKSEVTGYQINQLYSFTVTPYELAKSSIRAQNDATEEQEYYNSKGGLPHIVSGARIDDNNINECIGTYSKKDPPPKNRLVTMGVDVGKWLHYEIDEYIVDGPLGVDLNTQAFCKMVTEGKVATFTELEKLMYQYQIVMAIIDANPERRKAYEFTQKFYKHAYICLYNKNISGKQISTPKEGVFHVAVDRTSWMDAALTRFRTKRIVVPKDISEEYKEQIKTPIRIYKKDDYGNPVGVYVGGDSDHFAHARVYSEIALPLAAAFTTAQNVERFL